MGLTLGYIDPIALVLTYTCSLVWNYYRMWYITGLFYCTSCTKNVGLHKDTLIDIIFYSAIFGFIVARLYFVIFQWPYYMQNPGEIPKIWHGGIAIHGGLIGGFITGVIVCRSKNLHPLQIGDIVAPGIILAQGIGRWGNFMNHEAHGGPVSKAFLEHLHLPDFIIRNMYIEGQYYHPTFLYESVGCSRFYNSNYFKETSKNRETFFIYLIWYSIGRFFVEGLRTDSLMLTSHIRVAQLVSVILIVVSIILIVYRRVKYHPSTFKNSGPLQWPGKKA